LGIRSQAGGGILHVNRKLTYRSVGHQKADGSVAMIASLVCLQDVTKKSSRCRQSFGEKAKMSKARRRRANVTSNPSFRVSFFSKKTYLKNEQERNLSRG
jgi:hypothetical protein